LDLRILFQRSRAQESSSFSHSGYLEKLEAGELATEQRRKKFLDACAEELSVKRLEWQNIQVSLVAGAGNHLKLRFLSTYRRALDHLATEGRSGLFRAAG